MKIEFYYPHWGSEGENYDAFFQKVKNAGYHGVEMNIPFDEELGKLLRESLGKYDLKLIAQQWLEPKIETPESYLVRMEKYLRHLASFNPIFINSHTGRDYYSFETNCEIIEKVKVLENDLGVEIFHETHRGRFPFSAAATVPFLNKYPELKLTADFSHWVCVSESFLEDQMESVHKAIQHTHHLHARVGHTQSPQVTHPGAPEWSDALDVFMDWWSQVFDQRKGDEIFTVTTEFGPEPYLPTLPFTNQRVVEQWEVNLFMKNLIQSKY